MTRDLHKATCACASCEREDLARDIRGLLEEAEDLTRNNDVVVSRLHYGARRKSARAARRLVAKSRPDGCRPMRSRGTPRRHLDAPDLPIPDVIFAPRRAAAVNFCCGRLAYRSSSSSDNWPIRSIDARGAIAEYPRERRFGGLIAQTGS